MQRLTGIVVAAAFAGSLAGARSAQSDTPKAPPDKAVVIVRVPADAIVSIDGNVTNQKGQERRFVTPALEIGAKYSLEIVARWKAMGKEHTAKRTVDFKAGDVATVDLTKPDVPAKKIEPKKEKEPETKKEPPAKKTEPETKKEPPAKKTEPETKKEPPAKKTEPEIKKEPPAKKTEPEIKKEPEKKVESTRRVPEARKRTFLFTYAARIKELPAGTAARIWIPIATSNAQQEVTIVEQYLGDARLTRDPVYGNTIAYFEGKARNGVIPFEVTYKVRRKEVRTDPDHGIYGSSAAGEPLERYLQPDARVPVTGKPLDLLPNTPLPSDPVAAARIMYGAVGRHLKYKPDGPGVGEGDATQACVRGLGNCTDFHSVFIAMARGHRIPAKFEIGFAVPAKPGPIAGYHCWAWFCPDGKSWVPTDISQASRNPELTDYCFGNLDANRISFSVGRDIDLTPRQNGPPLNFFIDPYVEVNGKAYPQAKIQRRHAFREVPATK